MKKIFFHNTILQFNNPANVSQPVANSFSMNEIQQKGIHRFLQGLDTPQQPATIEIYAEQDPLPFLKESLTYLTAGGGLVENPLGQILFIKRHEKWDLPKGKPEPKESIEQTAVREVEEECGVSQLRILASLPSTYHIYPLDKQHFVLKHCYWFRMRCEKWENLTPQTQEGITEVCWFSRPIDAEILEGAFPSIRYLVEYFQKNY